MTGRRWVDQLAGIVGRAVGSAVTEALQRRTSTRRRAAQGQQPARAPRATPQPGETERADTRRRTTTGGAQPDETERADTQSGGAGQGGHAAYPGDFEGVPTISYDPHPGALPDPGEVAWTWVPYEEDHAQGKDRPVLVIGRDGRWLLALPLTSKDHDRDAAQEARDGRYWWDIGTGPWDRQGRASEVRLDRIVRVDASDVRREGAAVSRAVFNQVADQVLAHR